jgi:FAD/FMN-containing dehydrogenase
VPTSHTSAEASSLRASLRAAIGPDVLLESAADAAPFLTDHRNLFHGRALAVALPRSVDEVSKLLAWSNEAGVGVVPQGGNTSYCGGATPDDSGLQLVIGLRRLKRVRQVDAANFSMTVEAGCTLGEVQRAAADAQRFFPLELGSAESCQIGGNLATNAGGLNVIRYGMARALTLGIEAVLPDGQVLQHLRELQKDNTGYDLTGLLVGSEGTLGIITAATLKLWPPMRSTATALVAVPSVEAAVALLTELRACAGERVSSYELLPRSALELALRHIEGVTDPLGTPHPWYVLCELSSPAEESLERVLEQALTSASAAPLVLDAALAASERQRSALWRLRENFPEAQRRAGPSLKHDIAVPVGRLAEFVAQASAWVGSAVPAGTLVAYGHAGDGNLHFNISFPKDTTGASLSAQEPVIRRAIHEMVAAHGGSFSAEHGIGQLKVGELQRYTGAVELTMMRAVKQALDPRGIMNPGKLLARDQSAAAGTTRIRPS